jgi:hypothetical protein
MVDAETGLEPNSKTKNIIYESFKSNSKFMIDLENLSNKDTLKLYDSKNKKTIFRFY